MNPSISKLGIVSALYLITTQQNTKGNIMTSLIIHRVKSVKIERMETAGLDAIAWTELVITDDEGVRTSITLHHDIDLAPIRQQG
tara:strand:+ start:46 stop:300 length:255 start_codon:yes stop_codon:yes gene_type:complete